MRRMICHETTKNYNQLFSERLISNNIITKKALKSYIDSIVDGVNNMPTDENLLNGFHDSKLINKQSAGILYFIESMVRDRTRQSTSLLGLSKYSLEHVMPKKWENNWAAVETESERINRNKKILTLGNLTIITSSLNTSIRDANWNTKKNGGGNKQGLKQYSSGIEIFSSYLDKQDWNESTIEERANFLYEKAKEVWSNTTLQLDNIAEAVV